MCNIFLENPVEYTQYNVYTYYKIAVAKLFA